MKKQPTLGQKHVTPRLQHVHDDLVTTMLEHHDVEGTDLRRRVRGKLMKDEDEKDRFTYE